jgi:hypothetical protein
MSLALLLFLHIGGGTASLFAGTGAIAFRKGSRRHAYAGNLFVASMVLLAGSGVILAIKKSQPGNVVGGVLTLYLVSTGWLTARRGLRTDVWDWSALTAAAGIIALAGTYAVQALRSPTGEAHGYGPGPYIFLGIIATLEQSATLEFSCAAAWRVRGDCHVICGGCASRCSSLRPRCFLRAHTFFRL